MDSLSLCRCPLQSKEAFSLQTVFRDLDVDGNGKIDADEWRQGLSTLMGDKALSAEDADLVFGAIAGDDGDVKWPRFYSFFDGKAMTSRKHKLTSPFTVNPGQNLSTLSELEQDEKESSAMKQGQSLHVEAVKVAIAECLNLNADSMMFSGHTPSHSMAEDFNKGHGTHSNSMSLSGINFDADTFDALQSLQHIAECEDVLDLMEHHVFQCPDEVTMNKWDNRFVCNFAILQFCHFAIYHILSIGK